MISTEGVRMSKILGPILTFLLAIPLALVPLIAIVGLPSAEQLSNGSFGKTKLGQIVTHLLATPEEDGSGNQDKDTLPDAPAWGDQSAQVTSGSPAAIDMARLPASDWATNTSGSSMSGRSPGGGVTNLGWQEGQSASVPAMPVGSWKEFPMTASQAPQITWQQAVGQLNAMGIRDYHLKPGHRPGEFYFFCFFTPRDRPEVTIRYEAEADDPLKAVENVLQQIQGQAHQARRPAI